MTKQVKTEINISGTRAAYAKSAGAKLAYINALSLYLADVPDQILMEYTGDMKDIAVGSFFEKIHKERAALIDLVTEQGIKKAGARVYWKTAFDAVIKSRGLKRENLKGGKAKTAKKDTAEKDTAEKDTGYTPIKIAAQINQLITWANSLESADFNINQFIAHLNKAVKVIIK